MIGQKRHVNDSRGSLDVAWCTPPPRTDILLSLHCYGASWNSLVDFRPSPPFKLRATFPVQTPGFSELLADNRPH